MTTENYEFDVAISFLQQDENLAIQINGLLKDRVKTFIYSEQQKILAGRDGEKLFNKVFSEVSRIVVVLHRNDWAKTPWTKIEETAIRNRGFEFGYDFVTFIPLDKPVNVPSWLPKNRLWVGLEKWGIESAASVIEARVQEFGGNIKIETVADKFSKAQEEIKANQMRTTILNGSEGLELGLKEFKSLVSTFEKHIEEIKASSADWHLNIKNNDQQGINITGYGYYLAIKLYRKYSNNLDGTSVSISFWKGIFDDRGNKVNPSVDYKLFGEDSLKFDISKLNEYGWSNRENGKNFRLTKKVVEGWLTKFLDKIKKDRMEGGF